MPDNGTQGTEVNAYNASTGALDWTVTPFEVDMVAAPVAVNGIVYVNEVNGGGTGKAFGFNELSGAVVQSNPLITVDVTSPAVSHSGVYTSGDDLTTYDFAPTIVSAAAPPTFSGDTGQGTVVGVVDTGIDLANPDFQTNSGTRIVDLWTRLHAPTLPPLRVRPSPQTLRDSPTVPSAPAPPSTQPRAGLSRTATVAAVTRAIHRSASLEGRRCPWPRRTATGMAPTSRA